MPDLFQVGVIQPGTVIQTLVTFLEYRPHGTAVDSPGGMVVDLGLCARRPDENLQGVRLFPALIATGYAPVSLHTSRFFQERENLSLTKDGVPYKSSQEGSSPLQGQFRRKIGEFLQRPLIHRP
jgi:hypothetical protein